VKSSYDVFCLKTFLNCCSDMYITTVPVFISLVRVRGQQDKRDVAQLGRKTNNIQAEHSL